jgi:two-component system chemotaxis sensor kinase CheA
VQLKTIQRLSLVTSKLQEGIMQTRMQPMSTIWRKFPRVIRDLAVACGKEVKLVQEGEHTELDRSLLESIKDPLTHLIRNAVDHGIESPEIRESMAKPRQGRVLLRAYHAGGQVVVEISDDGAGIDAEKIKQKAVERGLIDARQAATMSEHELAEMIFRPGFSTAEKVTGVSGRGVGMDVVKTNIESIGGTITLRNRPGLGASVRISIPLTLAIIPALIVTGGNERFAIPQVSLIELLHYGVETVLDPVEWVHDAPVCRVRGSLLPLVYLRHALEIEKRPTTHALATNIVVVQVEDCRFGLVVDAVINTEEIVVKPLAGDLRSIPVFAGATIMGDGEVALILDIAGLARKAGLTVAKTEIPLPESEPGASHVATQPFLLCDSHDLRRIAIRLTDVLRLEEFRRDQVEWAATRESVQYGGEIMPLVRLTKLLNWPDDQENTENLLVVVHQHGGRTAGLVVPRTVDIVEGPLEMEVASDESGLVTGMAKIDGRVTYVIDLATAFHTAGVHFVEPIGNTN